jgi:hypothetical protein
MITRQTLSRWHAKGTRAGNSTLLNRLGFWDSEVQMEGWGVGRLSSWSETNKLRSRSEEVRGWDLVCSWPSVPVPSMYIDSTSLGKNCNYSEIVDFCHYYSLCDIVSQLLK